MTATELAPAAITCGAVLRVMPPMATTGHRWCSAARRTLEMTVIEGIKTTIPLHLKILAEPDFQAGRLSTAFMERFQPAAGSKGGLREAV